MPRVLYTIDAKAALLELAAQALAVLRLREFAQQNGLHVEESRRPSRREFALVIPPDGMNDVLWELDLDGLLLPTQEIVGPPLLHARLEERFATLTWVDSDEEAGPGRSSCGSAP